jgi:hypothetical protein
MSGAELAARLIALSAVVGLLAPQHEAADFSKRLTGQAGIDACNEVIDGPKAETNAVRRIQLIYARAIHRIEAGDYDGAIRDARLAATDQPAVAATTGFALGLGLSAHEIEAMALVGKGQLGAAKQQALTMAAAAPYDLINLMRAETYMTLTDDYGPAEQSYWAAFVRAYPEALPWRALMRERAGDFLGAAHDLEEVIALYAPIKDTHLPSAYARAALDYAFAGNLDKARQMATTARQQSDAIAGENGSAETVNATAEMLDFYAIWDQVRQGQLKDARLQFAGRSHWASVSPTMADRLAAQLRASAAPGELVGTLAKPAGSFASEALALRVKVIGEGGKDGKGRYGAIRAPIGDGAWGAFAGNIWHDGPSRYLAKKPDDKLQATAVNLMRSGGGTASGYALLLDCARSAERMGKPRFQLLAGRKYIFIQFVRFGVVGDPGVTDDASYDAARVEKDLAYLFPRG